MWLLFKKIQKARESETRSNLDSPPNLSDPYMSLNFSQLQNESIRQGYLIDFFQPWLSVILELSLLSLQKCIITKGEQEMASHSNMTCFPF